MKNAIYPCLWFDGNAGEAAKYYCTLFSNSSVTSDNQLAATFETNGQKFLCLNGGPEFTFNPSVSFYVLCETETEIDKSWNSLLAGGTVLMPLDKYDWSEKYGWIQDRFGVSWQLSLGKIEDIGQKITPTLMFTGDQNGKAEQAIHFYTSVFEGSGLKNILRYSKGDNDIEGTVKHSQFRLGSYLFMAMDSSYQHKFTFNEAISFVVECDTQKEIDYYWDRLTEGGKEVQCGWLKDRYGVSWQIIPSILNKLMSDPARSERVVNAFLKMKKFDIEKLIHA